MLPPRRTAAAQPLGGIIRRLMSSYPEHKVVAMPALSPTMEVGSVAKWNLKVGDSFAPGTAICEVATDKATVTFEAQDDGYVAHILVPDAGVEVKVGDPLLVTVDEEGDVAAFADFKLPEGGGASAPVSAAAPAAEAAAAPAPTKAVEPAAARAPAPTAAEGGERVFASPLAKKLMREEFASAGFTLAHMAGKGTGDGGRVTAADVVAFAKTFDGSAAATTTADAPSAAPATASAPAAAAPANTTAGTVSVAAEDFAFPTDGNVGAAVAAQFAHSKATVPHYCLSVEINMARAVAMRSAFNGKDGSLSVMDFVLKAAALAVKTVPDVNASWRDSFVRRYHHVDLNVVMTGGAGGGYERSDNGVVLPVLRNVGSMGLGEISAAMAKAESSTDGVSMGMGTLTVHNLGMYGVKSVAPIILPPQACALGVGAIVDTVVPAAKSAGAAADGEPAKVWDVAPVMMVTLSCDHRVVDGAVGAQYLQAFKNLLENPTNMLL